MVQAGQSVVGLQWRWALAVREANAGKPESWEKLTYNSNTDNDPNKAPNNCSHAETQGHVAITTCICVLFVSIAGIRQMRKCHCYTATQ